MFDLNLEDTESKCSSNKPIQADDVDDGMLQGTMEANDTNKVDNGMLQGTMEVDDINTQNFVNMEI